VRAESYLRAVIEEFRDLFAGRFRLERELGGGAMSRVFVAEELSLGRLVVLKVLPPDLSHAMSAARFEREIRLAARLQHPHIVPLLSAGEVDGTLYYSMPLVEGESLRSLLARRRELPVGEAVRILRDVADALIYAHGESIIHRDIKPDNILLSHGHAMVTDFGVARALAEAAGAGTLTGTGIAVGTPAYMAPEQCVGESQLDHRADLYALGVVAYELLSGEPPFHAASFQALVAAHLTQEPVPIATARSAVPPALAEIVHRCLEKRAADRYQTASELKAALDQLPLDSGSRSASRSTHTGITRRQALLGGATAGVLGLALGRSGIVGDTAADEPVRYQRLTFRRGLIRTARFAPDYQTVLYGAAWDGDVCRVYTVRPDSSESAPLTLPPAAPLAISSSGELALSVGDHLRGVLPYGTLARAALAGGAPREVQEEVRFADWSPDARELAVVRRSGDHDQLEFPAGTLLAEPSVAGGGFSFARVSPKGDAVAAFELSERGGLVGRVVVVDRKGTLRSATREYFNVFGLAWHGDEVWFTAAESLPLFRNTVYAMSRSGIVRLVTSIPSNVSLHDIAPDGRMLIARTDDRSGISVIGPNDREPRDLLWLDATVIADFSRDGRLVLMTEDGVGGGPNETAYLRDSDGAPAVRLGAGRALSLSPDTRFATVKPRRDSTHVEIVPTGAGETSHVSIPGTSVTDARWLPNGAELVARAQTADGRGRLYRVSARNTAAPRAVTPPDVNVGARRWALSPAGDRVAVSSEAALRLFTTADGSLATVRGDWSDWTVLGWITSGILVSRDPVTSNEIHRVDPERGSSSLWTRVQLRDPTGVMTRDLSNLRTTPDGRYIGYTWHRALSDLYLVQGWR